MPVDIDFDDRLTIVAGLNEAAKTTLFEGSRLWNTRSPAFGRDR
jgi:hypothetical protein